MGTLRLDDDQLDRSRKYPLDVDRSSSIQSDYIFGSRNGKLLNVNFINFRMTHIRLVVQRSYESQLKILKS